MIYNLRAHKSVAVHVMIGVAGAQLRDLPPDFPNFNPIENAFAKFKAILRNAVARTIDDLWNTLRDVLPAFSPRECENYLSSAGYEPD